jgi:uncharacterized protein (DUF1778 family)
MESMETAKAMTPPRFSRPHARKTDTVHIRLSPEELALISQAADAIGSPLSVWARVTLLAEARKVLRRARDD